MKISLMLFARARDLAGTSPVELDVPDSATIRDVHQSLLAEFPQLSPISDSLLWAANQEYVSVDRVVLPNDQLACFPPVSGG